MAFNLVKNNLEVRNSIKNKLKMIMIDEYQDTSSLQEDFISLIANHNVYMVGDIKQSIYRFRNACSDIFQNKYDRYKKNDDGCAIDLNSNFRSRKEVLEDINIMFKELMTLNIGGADYKKDH
ncbi:MAG: UvrD-helicase domain-containing protein, partial [Bacilli bacterium]|nr:UvrD-helicase domain-containing protein [Bacilli bacterium]